MSGMFNALATVVLLSFVPVQAKGDDVSVAGKIRDADGRPLQNVTISAGNNKTVSGEQGQFSLHFFRK